MVVHIYANECVAAVCYGRMSKESSPNILIITFIHQFRRENQVGLRLNGWVRAALLRSNRLLMMSNLFIMTNDAGAV